jgi:hypothetical protein
MWDRVGVPEAGWYEDPAGDGYRWWDGGGWTPRVVAGEGNLTPSRPPARARPRPAPSRPDASPGWVPGAISLLVAVGAVLLVVGSVQPWVHASAPGVASVTRIGTDARSAWLIVLAGIIVALEAGRWLQQHRPSSSGAVVALLAAVASGAVAVASFTHLAAGVESLPGATGTVTRQVGLGVPLIAAGTVAVFSGALAAALHRVG